MQELIELLGHIPFGGISFAGLVTLAIVLIFRGDIVPKSTLEAMRTDRDAIITSKNEEVVMLKEAYRLSEEARRTDAETDKELLELARTTVHLLQSIKQQANAVEV
jgi:hypothetical protein